MASHQNSTSNGFTLGQTLNLTLEDYSEDILSVKYVIGSRIFRGILLEESDKLFGLNNNRVTSSSTWPPPSNHITPALLKSLPCSTDRYISKSEDQPSCLSVFSLNPERLPNSRKQRPANISRILRPRRFVCRKCRNAFNVTEDTAIKNLPTDLSLTVKTKSTGRTNGGSRPSTPVSTPISNGNIVKPCSQSIRQVIPPIIPLHQLIIEDDQSVDCSSIVEEDIEQSNSGLINISQICSSIPLNTKTILSRNSKEIRTRKRRSITNSIKVSADMTSDVDILDESSPNDPYSTISTPITAKAVKRSKSISDKSHQAKVAKVKMARDEAFKISPVKLVTTPHIHLAELPKVDLENTNRITITLPTSLTGASSPSELGTSPGRKVKDCEKPKNRWIRAERMRRSQETDPQFSDCTATRLRTKSGDNDFAEKSPTVVKVEPDNTSSDQLHIPSLKIRIGRNPGSESGSDKCSHSSSSSKRDPVYSVLPINSDLENLTSYRIGDIVWSKLQGWPFWPAEITHICKNLLDPKRVTACLRWFAWNQVSYVDCDKLEPFVENYDRRYNKKRKGAGSYHQSVQQAMKAALKLKNDREVLPDGTVIVEPESVKEISIEISPKVRKNVNRKHRKHDKDDFSPKKRKPKKLNTDDSVLQTGPDPSEGELPTFVSPIDIVESDDILKVSGISGDISHKIELIDKSSDAKLSISQPLEQVSLSPIAQKAQIEVPTFSDDEEDMAETSGRLIIDPDSVFGPNVTTNISTVPKSNNISSLSGGPFVPNLQHSSALIGLRPDLSFITNSNSVMESYNSLISSPAGTRHLNDSNPTKSITPTESSLGPHCINSLSLSLSNSRQEMSSIAPTGTNSQLNAAAVAYFNMPNTVSQLPNNTEHTRVPASLVRTTPSNFNLENMNVFNNFMGSSNHIPSYPFKWPASLPQSSNELTSIPISSSSSMFSRMPNEHMTHIGNTGNLFFGGTTSRPSTKDYPTES